MNSTIVTTQVRCFEEFKQLLVGGIPRNLDGGSDDLFPVSGQGVPPFLSCVSLFKEFGSGDAAKVCNFVSAVEALPCSLLMSFLA
jgi:hypothetical protein